jgi:hypothetical protein
MVCALHALPPSVVENTACVELVVWPTTRQCEAVVVKHATPVPKKPVRTVWAVQVDPPSVVVMTTWEPAAMQCVVDGHDTLSRYVAPVGTVWAVHVAPPSVVARMSPEDV